MESKDIRQVAESTKFDYSMLKIQ